MNKSVCLIGLGALLLLGACTSTPADTVADYRYPRLAMRPPPQPVVEEIPQNPDPPTMLWRKGYWSYDGTDYTWVSGGYMRKPSFSSAWSADRWDKHLYGWGFVPGHWE